MVGPLREPEPAGVPAARAGPAPRPAAPEREQQEGGVVRAVETDQERPERGLLVRLHREPGEGHLPPGLEVDLGGQDDQLLDGLLLGRSGYPDGQPLLPHQVDGEPDAERAEREAAGRTDGASHVRLSHVLVMVQHDADALEDVDEGGEGTGDLTGDHSGTRPTRASCALLHGLGVVETLGRREQAAEQGAQRRVQGLDDGVDQPPALRAQRSELGEQLQGTQHLGERVLARAPAPRLDHDQAALPYAQHPGLAGPPLPLVEDGELARLAGAALPLLGAPLPERVTRAEQVDQGPRIGEPEVPGLGQRASRRGEVLAEPEEGRQHRRLPRGGPERLVVGARPGR